MVDTFYVNLEFTCKTGNWSINLPFLCNQCGICCTLDDFLTAGEVTATPIEKPEIHVKLKALYDELGKMWETNQVQYDEYIMRTPCPFLTKKSCSIYPIRPEGCRQYPNTKFGMQTQDCQALTRFKHQRAALKRGRATSKETMLFAGQRTKVVKAKVTEKQLQSCIAKLRSAGITDSELELFGLFNR